MGHARLASVQVKGPISQHLHVCTSAQPAVHAADSVRA